MDLPMGPVGVILGAVVVAAIVAWLLVVTRGYGRGRAPERRRHDQHRSVEIFMGSPGVGGGYVPHGDLGPSPRDRLKSPPDDDG